MVRISATRTTESLVTLGLIALTIASCTTPTGSPSPSPGASVTPTVAAGTPPASSAPAAANYKDGSYEIEGRMVTLANGVLEMDAAPGSASKIVTRYFGNEATGDLNGDGTQDVAFLLTQSRGGSGTFFYVVAALKTNGGYTGTNAVLLGDRIAPQTTELRDSSLIVNYADRKPGDAMTTPPSVGTSTYLKVEGGRLTVVPR